MKKTLFTRTHFFPKTVKQKIMRGFTIVELIMYMGLMTMVLTVLSSIFVMSVSSQLEAESLSSVQQDGRYLLAKLYYDINNAETIVSPSLGASATSLQVLVNSINYTYSVTGSGDLNLVNNFGTNQLNSIDTRISNLSFVQTGNVGGKNVIRVSFTLTSRIIGKAGAETEDFQTSIGTR